VTLVSGVAESPRQTGNVLETGGGNQSETERGEAARIRWISRETATSHNQPQRPNPPYKQEVAGSSPAPAMGRNSVLASVCGGPEVVVLSEAH